MKFQFGSLNTRSCTVKAASTIRARLIERVVITLVVIAVTVASFVTAQQSPVVAPFDEPEAQSLTRISHQLSAPADDALCPTVFSHIGMLDGRSSTTPRPSGRQPHWTQHLAALATKPGEKCGLTTKNETAPGETEHDGIWQYSLLDINGDPLPFSADEQVLEFLRKAEVVSITDLNRGITKPKKLVLEMNGIRAHAVFRSINVFRKNGSLVIETPALYFKDRYAYEVAAYELSQVLGFRRVPPVVVRKIGGVTGSVQIWFEDMIMNIDRRDRKLQPPDGQRWRQQDQMLALFDNIAGNLDRNLGNLLIDRGWTTWFIDHTRCFLPVKQPLDPDKVTECERGIWRTMQDLDSKILNERMKSTLNSSERKNLVARFEFMVEHIRQHIDARGEDSVLFDLGPADPPVTSWSN